MFHCHSGDEKDDEEKGAAEREKDVIILTNTKDELDRPETIEEEDKPEEKHTNSSKEAEVETNSVEPKSKDIIFLKNSCLTLVLLFYRPRETFPIDVEEGVQLQLCLLKHN